MVRLAMRATARGPSVTGANPAGPPNGFCDAEKAASIFHSSTKNSTAPNVATASTTNKQLFLEMIKQNVEVDVTIN